MCLHTLTFPYKYVGGLLFCEHFSVLRKRTKPSSIPAYMSQSLFTINVTGVDVPNAVTGLIYVDDFLDN